MHTYIHLMGFACNLVPGIRFQTSRENVGDHRRIIHLSIVALVTGKTGENRRPFFIQFSKMSSLHRKQLSKYS